MKKSTITSLAIGVLMLAGALCTKAVTPTVRLADTRPQIVLSKAIPTKFGDWQEDASQVAAVVNPTTVAELNKIYAETLSRTYVNGQGERIMLSIAYGTDQRDNLSVHFPEGCYGGQGFAVGPTQEVSLRTTAGTRRARGERSRPRAIAASRVSRSICATAGTARSMSATARDTLSARTCRPTTGS